MKKLAMMAVLVLLLGSLAMQGTLAYDFDPIFKPLLDALENFTGVRTPEKEDHTKVHIGLVYQMREGDNLVERDTNVMGQAGYSGNSFDWTNDKKEQTLGSHDYLLWDEDKLHGAVDKFISVKNLGSDSVYYCVAIAVSHGEDVMHLNLNLNLNEADEADFDWITGKPVTIKGEPYTMHLAIGRKPLSTQGEISPAALLQVALDPDLDPETVSKGVSIHAKAMAVETEGFGDTDARTALNAALHFEDAEGNYLTTFNPF